jgi:hypothetical protein
LAGANPQCMEGLDGRLVKKVWRKNEQEVYLQASPGSSMIGNNRLLI